MPNDIAILWDDELMEGDIDFDVATQDLTTDAGLESAVLISLFTDRRAKDDDTLPDSNSTDKRGWWGDLASPFVEGDQIGSRLWLLNREKTVSNVPNKARGYVEEALQWLIDDGVAARVDVETERQPQLGADILAIKATIYRNNGTVTMFKYDVQWNSQLLRS